MSGETNTKRGPGMRAVHASFKQSNLFGVTAKRISRGVGEGGGAGWGNTSGLRDVPVPTDWRALFQYTSRLQILISVATSEWSTMYSHKLWLKQMVPLHK